MSYLAVLQILKSQPPALETPKKYVCFKGEDCDITITFSLSTIEGITSNGQYVNANYSFFFYTVKFVTADNADLDHFISILLNINEPLFI